MPITVEHHALLLAYVAREACRRCGDAGEAAVLEGVRRYGERRGRRMAETARARGHPNDFVGFLLFGELDFAATGNVTAIEQGTAPTDALARARRVVTVASRCGWCNAWVAADLLEFGRLYCREIDAAVMHGFNPAYRFAAEGTMANGDAVCRFIYSDACLGPEEQERLRAGREQVGGSAVRPFSFHAAELLHVLAGTLVERCGDAGREAVEAAMGALAERFGDEAAAVVRDGAAAMVG